MIIVLDTNVLVSALLSAFGPSARVLDLVLHCRKKEEEKRQKAFAFCPSVGAPGFEPGTSTTPL